MKNEIKNIDKMNKGKKLKEDIIIKKKFICTSCNVWWNIKKSQKNWNEYEGIGNYYCPDCGFEGEEVFL